MKNTVFGKTMEIVQKHRDVKFVTIEKKNYLISQRNYHTTEFFTEDLLALEMKKMNKPVYLGLPILKLSKTIICEFWYDYIKPKYGKKARLYYMDTMDTMKLWFHCIPKNIIFCKDIQKDVKRSFDTSN